MTDEIPPRSATFSGPVATQDPLFFGDPLFGDPLLFGRY